MSKVLTIERAKWRRGGRVEDAAKCGQTRLLNEQGYMCCLGFDALACGFTTADILDGVDPQSLLVMAQSAMPSDYMATRLQPAVHKDSAYTHDNAPAVKEAMRANDDWTLHDEADREQRVRTALLKLGWDDVVFI